MKERIKKALLSIGGKNFKVQESEKTIKDKHKTFFIETLNRLSSIQERTDKVFSEYGLNLIMYEDLYFTIIEDLIYQYYGDSVAEIMFWWVNSTKFENEDENFIEDKDTKEKYKVKTPLQVYNVCKKLKLFKDK
tara:strand:+ start:7200 stop:7601 length:402 start_codon:yes stop_codon:yes gene_type:complete